jgi:hypothetical protein
MRYLALLSVLLAGCATTNWTHPNKTAEQMTKDEYDCRQDASQRSSNTGTQFPQLLAPGYYRECMINKHGYTPVKGTPEKQEAAQEKPEPKLPVTSDF